MTGKATGGAGVADSFYDILTGDDGARVCRDIPDSACRHQPRNFLLHAASLVFSKLGDGLADTKLVMAWLLTSAGVPASLIGLLVPLREALALLPQLVVSAMIRRRPVRKMLWTFASWAQGLCVAAIGLAALTFQGATLGVIAVVLTAAFALARSVASITHKDVLGKTVSKARRGTVGGGAETTSAALVFAVAAALALGVLPMEVPVVATLVMLAGLCWFVAGVLYSRLAEEPGATEGAINGLAAVRAQFAPLMHDARLRRFILTRALLISTALAPPFYVTLTTAAESVVGSLGPLMIASAAASVLSTYVWGRLADVSSRKVLMLAALLAALANGSTAALALWQPSLAGSAWGVPALLFLLMIAHQGVRLGRSTHIVDMADRDSRATYTALANSTIGVILLAGGVFGLVAQWAGVSVVLGLFTLMALAAIASAFTLDEVQAAD